MKRTLQKVPALGLVALLAVLISACSPIAGPTIDNTFIRISVGADARMIAVTTYEVTALQIAVYDPNGGLMAEYDWEPVHGRTDYLLPVHTEGEHEIVITHIGMQGDESYEAVESAFFPIEPGLITRIQLTPGMIGVLEILETDPALANWYLTSTTGEPWGRNDNRTVMDMVFGPGNWTEAHVQTVDATDVFRPQRLVFIDGSFLNANEVEGFITANQALIENWVAGGGKLFLNAAPNEGDGMSITLGSTFDIEYGGDTYATGVQFSDPAHPILSGAFQPVVDAYTGSGFSHAYISGPTTADIIEATAGPAVGEPVLSEVQFGSGWALLGGMTQPTYHQPNAEALNLRANIIEYLQNR